jgi:hypothetical protein
MKQHSSITCIWSIYLSVDTIVQSLNFLSWYPWKLVLLTRKLLNQRIVMVKFKSYFEILMVVTMTWLTAAEFLSHKWQWICSVCVITFPIHYFLHGLLKKEKVTRWVPHVEQELPTLPEDRVHPRFLVCLVLLDLLFSVFCRSVFVFVFYFHCVVILWFDLWLWIFKLFNSFAH